MPYKYNIALERENMSLRMEILLRESLTQLMSVYSTSNAPNWQLDKLISEIEQCLNEKAVLERDEVTGVPV